MAVNWELPIQTRDGRKARFLGKVNKRCLNRAVAYECNDGCESVACYRSDGHYLSPDQETVHDIINVPPEPKRVKPVRDWHIVYRSQDGVRISSGYVGVSKSQAEHYGRFVFGDRYISVWQLPEEIVLEVE